MIWRIWRYCGSEAVMISELVAGSAWIWPPVDGRADADTGVVVCGEPALLPVPPVPETFAGLRRAGGAARAGPAELRAARRAGARAARAAAARCRPVWSPRAGLRRALVASAFFR